MAQTRATTAGAKMKEASSTMIKTSSEASAISTATHTSSNTTSKTSAERHKIDSAQQQQEQQLHHVQEIVIQSAAVCSSYWLSSSPSEPSSSSLPLPPQKNNKVEEDYNKDDLDSLSLGERIQKGKTIITISNLISPEEIQYVKEACLELAESRNRNNLSNWILDNENVDGRLVIRMPTISAIQRDQGHHPAGGTTSMKDDALPETVSNFMEQVILVRVLQFIDKQLCSSIRTTLFPYPSITEQEDDNNGDKSDESHEDEDKNEQDNQKISLVDLYRNNQLQYSTREPAINVYHAPHGHFGIHRDNQALTVLIPFSNPTTNEFVGGGTAFWYQRSPRLGFHDPSITMKPDPGTIVLFGGNVQHCGKHIKEGKRVVFVASFSRLS